MRLIQYFVVLLNFRPFIYLFKPIYDLGLKCLLNSLSKRDGVYSVFGYGSFFEGRCLYGVSDIDFVLVLRKGISRSSPEFSEVALSYNRVRRCFPFLQHWYELDENLILLSEIYSRETLPESIRLRIKQGHLHLLQGTNVFEELGTEDVTPNEVITEVDNLLRLVLMKEDRHVRNLLFWKKNFQKLFALGEKVGLNHPRKESRDEQELGFMGSRDAVLFFRRGRPNELFGIFLKFSQEIFRTVQESEEKTCITFDNRYQGGRAAEVSAKDTIGQSESLKTISRLKETSLSTLPSSLVGIAPQRDYFPMDKVVNVIRIEDSHYETIRRLKSIVEESKDGNESFLIHAGDLLLIMTKYPSYVDIVPLDPLTSANIYTRVFQGKHSCEMPTSIYEEQQAKAENMFAIQAQLYRENDGWINRLPFPCLYVEDDLTVIQDALHRMRLFLLHSEGFDVGSFHILAEYLRLEHPNCREFLDDLSEYYRYLNGEREASDSANNLYHCLHQFMVQMLSGIKDISIDDHRKHLGITVGIITRDRAGDLKEALESLTHQIRLPDEVVIVDNGSSDDTRFVINEYQERLPIRSYFLEEASIPVARNMVIKNARQEVVSFTDDDCIVDPGWLVSVERGFLRAGNIGIVGGWVKHAADSEESIVDSYYRIFHHNKP